MKKYKINSKKIKITAETQRRKVGLELNMEKGIKAYCQVLVPLNYKGFELSKEFKIDILVEDEIIIELKSVESMLPVFEAQLISYLRLTNKKQGFLINFNVPLVKNGIKRYVNNY